MDPTASPEAIAAMVEELDFAQMERIRARVDELVDDPVTAEALKPYYSRFCKRPTFNDEYLQTFNRPNVTLIDTDGRGLDRITETGMVFDGREYPVDCIVYATGFEFAVATTRSGGFEVYSPSGQALSDHRAEARQVTARNLRSRIPQHVHHRRPAPGGIVHQLALDLRWSGTPRSHKSSSTLWTAARPQSKSALRPNNGGAR